MGHEFEGPFVDKNLYWSGLLYGLGTLALGASWWQAGCIALFALICWYLTYGRFVLANVGVVLVLLALAQWGGLLPHLRVSIAVN